MLSQNLLIGCSKSDLRHDRGHPDAHAAEAAYDPSMARTLGIIGVGHAPRDVMADLFAQLRGERDVKLSEKAVIARSPETFARLRADGCDVIVHACRGDLPPREGGDGVLLPSRVLREMLD
jgi:hypothetical protein